MTQLDVYPAFSIEAGELSGGWERGPKRVLDMAEELRDATVEIYDGDEANRVIEVETQLTPDADRFVEYGDN